MPVPLAAIHWAAIHWAPIHWLSPLLLCATGSTPQEEAGVVVHDTVTGCYLFNQLEYEWRRDGGEYVLGKQRLPVAAVEAARAEVLACRENAASLLADVGVTPASIASRHAQIAALAVPENWIDENGDPRSVPAELEHLFGYDYLAPLIRNELCGHNWGSTTSRRFRVTLPGDPPVTVESTGLVPWMLPWTITAGEDTWTVEDVRVSRAVLPFADPAGPSADVLDGTAYWTDEFWTGTASFWRGFVRSAVDAALAESEYTDFPGWPAFAARFQVDDAMTGNVNLKPLAMYIQVSALYPSAIDEVRWWNLIESGAPTSDWQDFLHVYDRATSAVDSQGWLTDWKNAGPNRTLGLDAVGRQGYGETHMELFVDPIWEDAEFGGEPEFEILMRRDGKWCGTVFLSSSVDGALITRAKPGEGQHWFDAQDFSYHPRSKPPTYGSVNAEGEFALRTVP